MFYKGIFKNERKGLMQRFVLIGVVVGTFLLLCANCGRSEREGQKELIQDQIEVVEKQVSELENHQSNLRESIHAMQQELEQMDRELDKISPRLKASRSSLSYLRELSIEEQGESALARTMRNIPITTHVLLWILVLWLFYRIRIRRNEPNLAPATPVVSAGPARTGTFSGVSPAERASAMERPAPRPGPPKPGSEPEKGKASPRNKGCKVKGCNNKHRSKGFCNKHYQQWRRGTLKEPLEE
jgi:outer membrane murein-binding lipoprotein Lpp